MADVDTVLERVPATTTKAGIVDCDIHPVPRDRNGLKPYLSKRWQQHLDEYGDPQDGPYCDKLAYPRYQPAGVRRDAWPPNGGPPGSDVAFMRTQHLDRNNIALGILEPLILGFTSRNLDLGNALCSALNDWQVAEFVEPEPRLRASIHVALHDCEASVAEIEKRAPDYSFAQVQLPSFTVEPLGHRRFRPILEAAAHHGFPIGIHVGGTVGVRTGSGSPTHYQDAHYAFAFSAQTQVASMILDGVFEQLPNLRVIMVEGGCVWAIGLAHRLDRLWQRMRSEVPYLKHPPSHYLRQNFYFSTQPIEEPDNPDDLVYLFEQIGWDRVLYASDYPHWDFDDPKYAFKGNIPEDKKRMLMRENAKGLYRLP